MISFFGNPLTIVLVQVTRRLLLVWELAQHENRKLPQWAQLAIEPKGRFAVNHERGGEYEF